MSDNIITGLLMLLVVPSVLVAASVGNCIGVVLTPTPKTVMVPCGISGFYEFKTTNDGAVIDRACVLVGSTPTNVWRLDCNLSHADTIDACNETIRLKTGDEQ
jgi:hypothetical protein